MGRREEVLVFASSWDVVLGVFSEEKREKIQTSFRTTVCIQDQTWPSDAKS